MALEKTQTSIDYASDGETASFTVPFPVLEPSHLVVTSTDSNGDTTTLQPGSDYTVAINVDAAGSAREATVALTVPLPSGNTLTISRVVPLVQSARLSDQGGAQPKQVEKALDYLTMIAQQLAIAKDNDGDSEAIADLQNEMDTLRNALATKADTAAVQPRAPSDGRRYLGTADGWSEYAGGGEGGGGTSDHRDLSVESRTAPKQHTDAAIVHGDSLDAAETVYSVIETMREDLGKKADANSLGEMALVADAPADGKTYGRKNGAWTASVSEEDFAAGLNSKAPVNAPQMSLSTDFSFEEQWTGQYWIDGKKIYQKVVAFGALPNNATKQVPHLISPILDVIEGWGMVRYIGLRRLLPLASADGFVDLHFNFTNIIITTSMDLSHWVDTFIIMRYTCPDR